MDARFTGLEASVDARIDSLRKELNTRLYWLVGLIFAGWASMLSAFLLK